MHLPSKFLALAGLTIAAVNIARLVIIAAFGLSNTMFTVYH